MNVREKQIITVMTPCLSVAHYGNENMGLSITTLIWAVVLIEFFLIYLHFLTTIHLEQFESFSKHLILFLQIKLPAPES